jgi:hypothetical protein
VKVVEDRAAKQVFADVSGYVFSYSLEHKGFEDPAALQGTEKERLSLFRRVRDEIRDYLKVFPS